MRLIGFSTGSLSLGDFRGAVKMLIAAGVEAVELSALRLGELPALADAVSSLPLATFRHVSVHAPSRVPIADEGPVIGMLRGLVDAGFPIVAHPDTIYSYGRWAELGSNLWIENMDTRKLRGRSAAELQEIFEQLPEAGLCIDLAHARQYDPSMVEAYRILRLHRARIRQLHLSEVSSTSKHTRLSFGAIHDYSGVARWIPADVPAILESPVGPDDIELEIDRARVALLEPSAAAA